MGPIKVVRKVGEQTTGLAGLKLRDLAAICFDRQRPEQPDFDRRRKDCLHKRLAAIRTHQPGHVGWIRLFAEHLLQFPGRQYNKQCSEWTERAGFEPARLITYSFSR